MHILLKKFHFYLHAYANIHRQTPSLLLSSALLQVIFLILILAQIPFSESSLQNQYCTNSRGIIFTLYNGVQWNVQVLWETTQPYRLCSMNQAGNSCLLRLFDLHSTSHSGQLIAHGKAGSVRIVSRLWEQ